MNGEFTTSTDSTDTYTFGWVTVASDSSYYSPISKYVDPTSGMTNDEKRVWERYRNRLKFEDFVDVKYAVIYRGSIGIKLVSKSPETRFGTSNTLRPVPMLC